ncbi:DNA mismatch repair protein MutS [Aestuariibius sp. 2305UL40-4]|uniref:DNA mismatch repair protein MutS n=1 Tax=Aestuariibius violaceus TaxID=3234132 RepID=UPI00345E5244
MMAQYLEIKADHPDALLFYRMGDFYEMFFDDAVAAAEALDIALTKRGKHQGTDIPMCGVPVHSAESYLLTLIRKGFRVAVCEQMEDPAEAKKRGSKAVVRREVVRLVTPGTLTEESLLEARRHNYLAAFVEIRGEGGLAWCDISTGALRVMACPFVRLGPELARLSPREVLVPEGAELALPEEVVTEHNRLAFDSEAARGRVERFFDVASLDAFGQFSRAEVAAMGALIDYLDLTQKGRLPLLRPPVQESEAQTVRIDAATRRNLELSQALAGGRAGSLLAVIDRTVTAGGGRLLERRLGAPSRRIEVVTGRLDAVSDLVADELLRVDLREALRRAPDLDRALSRLALDRGGPRDLAAVRTGLEVAARIEARMGSELSAGLLEARRNLCGLSGLREMLDAALVAEPPLLARDGGFVAAGHLAELDEAQALRDEGRSVVAGMQVEFAEATGIGSLKVKHNNVLGYFIEVTATHAEKMLSPPLSETFIHRQTTANAVRFTTVELSSLETKILNAGARAIELEKEVFAELRQQVIAKAAEVGQVARALAEVDLAAALADLAVGENWVRPVLDEGRAFTVKGGRHPVVEAALKGAGEPFVANDCDLTAHRLQLLTGPNMAGKSTFLRQNALIAILAQMGSYVPARKAEIGLVSQIFSRVGASDDLARGRSTFMVEMVETAAILNQADDRALVILDEIGRGTATYDGLSIAWATLEHLHDVNRCRAIFATHYHELTALAAELAEAENLTVAVKEWQGDVVFLHEVRKGAADRSYGVQVAKLAGLPEAVVARARAVLERLEEGERGKDRRVLIDDLPLFSVPSAPAPTAHSEVEAFLQDVNPDEMTAREALDLIYELKGRLGE